MDDAKAWLIDSTRSRKISWKRISTGNFRPRPLASSITSVRSTTAPLSPRGLATTCPASLMSKYLAPQRLILYKARAAWMSQEAGGEITWLISIAKKPLRCELYEDW